MYDNPSDLAYKVCGAIEDDVTQMGVGSLMVRRCSVEHAIPRARLDGSSLVIENKSEKVRAEQFRFVYDRGANVKLFYDGEPVDLLPDSDMRLGHSSLCAKPSAADAYNAMG